jgi:hypothetical protein
LALHPDAGAERSSRELNNEVLMGLAPSTLLLAAATACLWVLASVPLSARASDYYEGLAYAKGGQTLLYREAHWLHEDGSRLVLYLCPLGEPFARKHVRGGRPTPDFEFVDARSGYREGVRTRDGWREVFARDSATAQEQRKRLAPGAVQVIDAGFDSYIRQHWEAMAPPAQRRVSFLIPSRLQVMDFRLDPIAGPAGSRSYRMGLDAWYGRALPSIAVTYSAGGRRLVRFEGIGNIRDGAGRYSPVRIEFPADRSYRASKAERERAAAATLVASCRDA